MPQVADFDFDVFLSHSSKDRVVVRSIAQKLQDDGLRVWLDAWQIKPGDSIPAKIEDGLEHSRVLILCMSANAFGSDWAHLEAGTFRFRDPLNKERRFIPLRLDNAPIKGSLAQFLYVNWHPKERKRAYAKLLEACQPPAAGEQDLATPLARLKGPIVGVEDASVLTWAFSLDGARALAGRGGGIVELWDVEARSCLLKLEGHTDSVWWVAWASDGCQAISSGNDAKLRLWDLATGRCLRVFEGHSNSVRGLAWAADQNRIISGSDDETIRLWDGSTGECLQAFKGLGSGVWAVAISPDQRCILAGLRDGTVRTLRCWRTKKPTCP